MTFLAIICHAEPTFINHGIGANVAEARGAEAVRTKDGRCLLLANSVDCGTTAYIVVIDVDKEETKIVFTRKGIGHGTGAFGSIMSANGKFYTGRGSMFLEFDPDNMTWSYEHRLPKGSHHLMSFAETDGGKIIWAACYPNCMLVSYNTDTRVFSEHGRLETVEQYPQSLAIDKHGWVYAGIGTSKANVVAFNPATKEMRPLLKDEERGNRKFTAKVVPLANGQIKAYIPGKTLLLENGTVLASNPPDFAPEKYTGALYYGMLKGALPDGRKITRLDFNEKFLTIIDANGKSRNINFDFQTGGSSITSLALGPNNGLYASSAHPFRLIRFLDNQITDLGQIPVIGGGNMCALAFKDNFLYGAEYAGGRLWKFNADKPLNVQKNKRKINGLDAAALVAASSSDNGTRIKVLENLDVAFFISDSGAYNVNGHFTLNAEKPGQYYVKFVPYIYGTYCDAQYFFDDKPLGTPFQAGLPQKKMETLSFGPFDIAAGPHKLTVRLLETKGKQPFCSLVAASLTQDKNLDLIEDAKDNLNPVIASRWADDITRPRACLLHNDGNHILFSGYANYGLCGGGIGIYDIQNNKSTLLEAKKDLLDGHSCVTLKCLPNGNLIGGTATDAPGGGKRISNQGEIFIVDWAARKLLWRGIPIPNSPEVCQLHVTPDGLVLGLARPSTFFVFDPASKKVIKQDNWTKYGGIPRHLAFIPDNSGNLFVLMRNTILKVDQKFFRETVAVSKLPAPVSVGGAFLNGRIYYASEATIWSWGY